MAATADSVPDLTSAEQELRTAFIKGIRLDLIPAGPARGLEGGPADVTRPVIRAGVIRDLLLSGTAVASGRVRLLSVSGAAIQGGLDLGFAELDCPLFLEQCVFDSPVTLYEAHLRSVSLRGSTVPGIDAGCVRVTGNLNLDDVHVTGRLRLAGAHLRDGLRLADATIELPSIRSPDGDGSVVGGDFYDPVLDLDNIEIEGNLEAPGLIVHGTVSSRGATVAGPWRMPRARILGSPQSALAWNGEDMRIEGNLDASRLHASGQLRLIDTQVLNLIFRDVKIENSRTALVLDRLDCRGSVFCDGRSYLTGGMHAWGIQAGGTLYLGAGVAKAPARGAAEDMKHAVDLRRARITGELKCNAGFCASGACNLDGAHIGGRVSFSGATLRPVDGTEGQVAFTADGAEIGGDLSLQEDFSCRGRISLVGARIGGGLTVVDHRSDGQCTLDAEGLSVARDVTLDPVGTVDLSSAGITGEFTLHLQRLKGGDGGAAADLSAVTADVLFLIGRPANGFLDLTRAKVRLVCDELQDWPEGNRIVLDDFEYQGITTVFSPGQDYRSYYGYRLRWVKTGAQWTRGAEGQYEDVGFIPQPYQQLAAAYRNAGDDGPAAKVLWQMRRRRNQLVSWHSPGTKLWNYVLDVFIGYGYAPARALLWIVFLVAFNAFWFSRLNPRVGMVTATVRTLGTMFPAVGLERWPWAHMNSAAVLLAAELPLYGLLLGGFLVGVLGRALGR